MAYGMLDSLWQVFCYYTMGAMSNDPRKLAYYAGFYKSIQAVGATTISKLDAVSSVTTLFQVLFLWQSHKKPPFSKDNY